MFCTMVHSSICTGSRELKSAVSLRRTRLEARTRSEPSSARRHETRRRRSESARRVREGELIEGNLLLFRFERDRVREAMLPSP